MDQSFLYRLEQTNARLKSKQEMAVLLLEQPSHFRELIEIANNPNQEFALKAIWTIEQAVLMKPLSIATHIEFFIETLPESHQDSNLRSIAKVCSILLTNPKLKKEFDQLPFELKQHMIHCNFNWFTEPYRVAVKVHSMENLSRLCELEEWIKPNLVDLIELHYQSEGPAYQARARMVLKRLKKLN